MRVKGCRENRKTRMCVRVRRKKSLQKTKVELRKPQKKAGSFVTVDSGSGMKQCGTVFFVFFVFF